MEIVKMLPVVGEQGHHAHRRNITGPKTITTLVDFHDWGTMVLKTTLGFY